MGLDFEGLRRLQTVKTVGDGSAADGGGGSWQCVEDRVPQSGSERLVRDLFLQNGSLIARVIEEYCGLGRGTGRSGG